MNTLEYVGGVFHGSNADRTRELYAKLTDCGPMGVVALNLLRISKTSGRAKKYRGGNSQGSYRNQSYATKDWSLQQLTSALVRIDQQAPVLQWGWGYDAGRVNFEHCLYVDLPPGQVSFHNSARKEGPDYPSVWDGVKLQQHPRCIAFAVLVLDRKPITSTIGVRHVARKAGTEGGAVASVPGEQSQKSLSI